MRHDPTDARRNPDGCMRSTGEPLPPLDLTGRWWVFGFEHYYPSGGMQDFVGSYTEESEAMKRAGALLRTGEAGPADDPEPAYACSEVHIVDTQLGIVQVGVSVGVDGAMRLIQTVVP